MEINVQKMFRNERADKEFNVGILYENNELYIVDQGLNLSKNEWKLIKVENFQLEGEIVDIKQNT